MIIQCEECRTKFNIDETLLKNEGSKVRCSLCKHIFVAYLPDQIGAEEPLPVSVGQEELDVQEESIEAGLEDEFDFDRDLEESLEDIEGLGPDEETEDSFEVEDIEEVDHGKDLEESQEDIEGVGFDEDVEDSLEVEDKDGLDFDKELEESLEGIKEGEAAYNEDLHGVAEQEMASTEEPIDGIQMEDESLPEDIEEEFEEELVEQDEITAVSSEPKRSGRSYALFFFLAVIFVLIVGSVAVIFWAPDLIPDSLSILKPAEEQEVTDLGNVRLSFKPTLGFYINSEKAGQLFVIQGIVENDYPTSRSFILVKGILWDDKGQMVKEKLAYAGNSIKREDLAVLPLEEINKAMKNREGAGRKNVNVAPGASIPFTIVFENLPENVSQYGGEVVSSSLGSP